MLGWHFRHCASIGAALAQWVRRQGQYSCSCITEHCTSLHKAYKRCCPNVDLSLGQHRRRWANVNSTLGQRWVSFLLCQLPRQSITQTPIITRDVDPMLNLCWPSVVDGGPTWTQHWGNGTENEHAGPKLFEGRVIVVDVEPAFAQHWFNVFASRLFDFTDPPLKSS